MKQKKKLSAPLCKKQNGSTMVGVLAAIVFVGIVTTFMVNNTGNQSAASRGYGTSARMSSTLVSGVFAMETWFTQPNNALRVARIADSAINNRPLPDTFLIANQNKGKREIASGQAIGSHIGNIRRIGNDIFARISINAGRNENDNSNLHRAAAFGKLGNLGVLNGENVPWAGSDAISFGGGLTNLDHGLTVNGNATIMGDVVSQGNNSYTFNSNSVYIGGTFRAERPTVFSGDVYFHGCAPPALCPPGAPGASNIRGQTTFNGNVGFNGAVEALGTVQIPQDLYMNEGFVQAGSTIFMMSGGTARFAFRNAMANNPLTGAQRNVQGFNLANVSPRNERIDIFDEMGYDPARFNAPTIDLERIPPCVKFRCNVNADGDTTVTTTYRYNTGSFNNTFSVDKLNDMYNEAQAAGNLFNDHLVVYLGPGTLNFAPDPPEFDNKVIFIVDRTLNTAGRFYPSGPNASTMMYVAQNGDLTGFGFPGIMRGLIYINENNTKHHMLNWENGGELHGALISNGTQARIQLNRGPMVITFDAEALSEFGALQQNLPLPPIVVQFPGDTTINFQPFSYYFY